MKPIQVINECYDSRTTEVKNGGNSGRIFVPKSWTGKKVMVLLLEPIEGQ